MPISVLFHRFVVDTVVGPGSTLVPANEAPWRWEPALDEADLVDRLASLAAAPDRAIARTASRFGPLRLRASTLAVRASFVRENVARDSVSMLSELDNAHDWYAAGMLSAEPRYARAYVAAGSALSTLAADTQEAVRRLLDDSESSREVRIDFAPSLVQLVVGFGTAYLAPPPPRSETVLRGMDTLDRIMRGLAGIEPIPALDRAGGSGRVLLELLVSLPEILTWIRQTGSRSGEIADGRPTAVIETTTEWRSVATYLTAVREAIELISAVSQRPLSADETQRLRKSANVVTGWAPESNLRAAEIADRLAPLIRATLERELDAAGIWPVRQGVTTGCYWRALATVWEGLTDQRMPRLCASEGCDRAIGARRNRLYCDIHRAERQRDRVRRARAPSAQV